MKKLHVRSTLVRAAAKGLLALLLLSSAFMPLGAKSMRDIWVSTPDTLLPYLNAAQRTEMVDLLADVKNKLEEDSRIDTLATDFMAVRLHAASTLQIKRLPAEQGDSILGVIQTFLGEKPESRVAFYTQDWAFLKAFPLGREGLGERPDTMGAERFAELQSLLDPFLVSATWIPGRDEMLLEGHAPALSMADEQALSAILLQRKLKWNADTLNLY